jgi:tetratricopeptide (TPR) repeat protein
MKRSLVPLLLLTAFARADEFSDQFKRIRESNDHPAMVAFLADAGKTEAANPNYYALAANYWWRFADQPNLSTKPAKEGEPSIRDPKSGEEVGSISTNGDLDPTLRKKALDLTAEGFRKFPERLDIGFGLAQVQFKTGQKEEAVATIGTILKVSKERPGDLKWSDGVALPDPPAKMVPESIHGYTVPLLEEGTPGSMKLCQELCEATIAAYPEHPYSYNILAALADARDDRDEVMRMLKLAHEKAPQDALILLNLAESQRAAKQTKEAIASYKKVLALDADEELKEAAQEGIEAVESGEEE